MEMAEKRAFSHEIDDYGSFAYDGVWTLALMLNRSIDLLRAKNLTLDGFRYKSTSSKIYLKLFQQILDDMQFNGVTVGG